MDLFVYSSPFIAKPLAISLEGLPTGDPYNYQLYKTRI